MIEEVSLWLALLNKVRGATKFIVSVRRAGMTASHFFDNGERVLVYYSFQRGWRFYRITLNQLLYGGAVVVKSDAVPEMY